MSISSLIYRLDLFALEIMVEGFLTVDSMGRKVYSKGRVIKWDVEFGSYTVELLMKCLQTEVNWAPNQSATVWGCLEKNATKKKVKCSRCKEFGHFAKTCQTQVVGEDGETATPKR